MTTKDAYSNEQAKNLMDTWAKSQVQFWENWLGGSEAIATTTVEAEPIEEPEEVQDKMLDKEVVLRFLELSQMAWKDLLAMAASRQNRQPVEPPRSDRFGQQFSSPAGTAKANRDAAELWLMYLKGMQEWGQFAASSTVPPLSPFPSVPPLPPLSAKSDRPELNELASFYQSLYQKSLSGFLTNGLPGYSPSSNKELLQGFYVWSSIYKATLEYQLAIADIWTRAFDNTMKS